MSTPRTDAIWFQECKYAPGGVLAMRGLAQELETELNQANKHYGLLMVEYQTSKRRIVKLETAIEFHKNDTEYNEGYSSDMDNTLWKIIH